jgi:hypothetical protein
MYITNGKIDHLPGIEYTLTRQEQDEEYEVTVARLRNKFLKQIIKPTAIPTATPIATPIATLTATPTATPIATSTATPTATPIATPVKESKDNYAIKSTSLNQSKKRSTIKLLNSPTNIEKRLKKSLKTSKKVDSVTPFHRTRHKETLTKAILNRIDTTDEPVYNIAQIVERIDNELFKVLKDNYSSYNKKFRSIQFNVNDKSNNSFYKFLIDGSIKANELPKMKTCDMASEKKKDERKLQEKNDINAIVMAVEQNNDEIKKRGLFLKKTHKGEVEIGGNDVGAFIENTPLTPLVNILPQLLEASKKFNQTTLEESLLVESPIIESNIQDIAEKSPNNEKTSLNIENKKEKSSSSTEKEKKSSTTQNQKEKNLSTTEIPNDKKTCNTESKITKMTSNTELIKDSSSNEKTNQLKPSTIQNIKKKNSSNNPKEKNPPKLEIIKENNPPTAENKKEIKTSNTQNQKERYSPSTEIQKGSSNTESKIVKKTSNTEIPKKNNSSTTEKNSEKTSINIENKNDKKPSTTETPKEKNTSTTEIQKEKNTSTTEIPKEKNTSTTEIQKEKNTSTTEIQKEKNTSTTEISMEKNTSNPEIIKEKDPSTTQNQNEKKSSLNTENKTSNIENQKSPTENTENKVEDPNKKKSSNTDNNDQIEKSSFNTEKNSSNVESIKEMIKIQDSKGSPNTTSLKSSIDDNNKRSLISSLSLITNKQTSHFNCCIKLMNSTEILMTASTLKSTIINQSVNEEKVVKHRGDGYPIFKIINRFNKGDFWKKRLKMTHKLVILKFEPTDANNIEFNKYFDQSLKFSQAAIPNYLKKYISKIFLAPIKKKEKEESSWFKDYLDIDLTRKVDIILGIFIFKTYTKVNEKMPMTPVESPFTTPNESHEMQTESSNTKQLADIENSPQTPTTLNDDVKVNKKKVSFMPVIVSAASKCILKCNLDNNKPSLDDETVDEVMTNLGAETNKIVSPPPLDVEITAFNKVSEHLDKEIDESKESNKETDSSPLDTEYIDLNSVSMSIDEEINEIDTISEPLDEISAISFHLDEQTNDDLFSVSKDEEIVKINSTSICLEDASTPLQVEAIELNLASTPLKRKPKTKCIHPAKKVKHNLKSIKSEPKVERLLLTINNDKENIDHQNNDDRQVSIVPIKNTFVKRLKPIRNRHFNTKNNNFLKHQIKRPKPINNNQLLTPFFESKKGSIECLNVKHTVQPQRLAITTQYSDGWERTMYKYK